MSLAGYEHKMGQGSHDMRISGRIAKVRSTKQFVWHLLLYAKSEKSVSPTRLRGWGLLTLSLAGYEHKMGQGSHDMRISGRIAKVRSTKQFVWHLLLYAKSEKSVSPTRLRGWGLLTLSLAGYEHKMGQGSHDMRISGRIAKVRSTKQFVWHLLLYAKSEKSVSPTRLRGWGLLTLSLAGYEHKMGQGSHDMRISGRIAKVRSTKQFVWHLLLYAKSEKSVSPTRLRGWGLLTLSLAGYEHKAGQKPPRAPALLQEILFMNVEKISKFTVELLLKYYDNDIQLFLDACADDVLWIGPAENQVIRTSRALKSAFAAEHNNLHFAVHDLKAVPLTTGSPHVCEVVLFFIVDTIWPDESVSRVK